MAGRVARLGRWYAWRVRYNPVGRVYEFEGGNLPSETVHLPVDSPVRLVSPHRAEFPRPDSVTLRSTRCYTGQIDERDAWRLAALAVNSNDPALAVLVEWLDRAGFNPVEWLDILPVGDRPSFEIEPRHNPIWQEWNV